MRFLIRLLAGSIVTCLLFLNVVPSLNAIPASIVYQGSLKQSGVVVNGTYPMIFNITNVDGSQIYWTSGSTSVVVREGLYRVELTPTGVTWPTIDPYFETRINGSILLPREKLSNTPYALIANQVAAGSVLAAGNGALNAPSYSFSNDHTTGMYLSATNELSFATKSFQRWIISSFGNLISVGCYLWNSDGLVSSPSYSFASDSHSGIYLSAPSELSIATAGTQRWMIRHGDLTSVNASNILSGNGVATNPGISFANDVNSGFYLFGTSQISVSLGSTTHFQFAPGVFAPFTSGTERLGVGSAKWFEVWAQNGVIQTSSSKFKTDIKELLPTQSGFSAVSIAPPAPANTASSILHPNQFNVPRGIMFKWKKENSLNPANQDIIGFMGDDLPLEAHAVREDGTRDPENYYTSSVIGLLCAKVRQQDDLIAKLTMRVNALEGKGK